MQLRVQCIYCVMFFSEGLIVQLLWYTVCRWFRITYTYMVHKSIVHASVTILCISFSFLQSHDLSGDPSVQELVRCVSAFVSCLKKGICKCKALSSVRTLFFHFHTYFCPAPIYHVWWYRLLLTFCKHCKTLMHMWLWLYNLHSTFLAVFPLIVMSL